MARKMTLDDLWSLETIEHIALAPDGRRVALVIQTNQREEDEERRAIFLLHLDAQGRAEGALRRLTWGGKNETAPVWAPDSRRLLFLSDRGGGKSQLYLIDTDGGEARVLSNMLRGVSESAWSPDGKWIAFTAPAAPEDEDDILMGRKVLNEEEKRRHEEQERYGLKRVTDIWYRLDGLGLLSSYTHLFCMPAPTGEATTSDPAAIQRLTSGDYNYSLPAWTPDSQEISALCNRREDRDRTFGSDLWAVERETGKARCLTEGTLSIASYSWSPDGNSAIVVGEKETITQGLHDAHLYLVTRKGNEGDRVLDLTPDLDIATQPTAGGSRPGPYLVQWSKDGQRIYFLATERTSVSVYSLEIVWRNLTRLSTEEVLTHWLALLPGEEALLVAQERPDRLCELYRQSLQDGALEQVTHVYDPVMNELAWAKTEHFLYEGADGDQIDGWLLSPVGAREGERYPLLVQIHGGPNWAFGLGIDPLAHYFTTRGYAVFYCNPHGSTGCGAAFMRSVVGDWGGRDYEDIIRGVDMCIARGVADPDRLFVTGYSYGGFMSMFVIGQTGRFKAAVPMAGISNLASFVGTSDLGFWMVSQAEGYPWEAERADYYRERSPLSHAPRVTTPTLLLHPENDLRCPIAQSEEFYQALKMVGKTPVEFVRAPGSWHGGTAKPSQWFAYWETMLAWCDKYNE